MPRLAAAAVARRAGEALRRGALGGLRSLSSLQPSHAASTEEVTERRAALPIS
jgi:3-hydroxyisobutyryl-CoA hydrolase